MKNLDELKKRFHAWRWSLKEWQRQIGDQTFHVLMALASVVVISKITVVAIGVVATIGWIGYREYKQWPSSRWWDPYLDWTFQASGIGLGVWLYL